MATTYYSDKVLAGAHVPAKGGIGDLTVVATFEAATALVIDDVIQMVKIPAGATVTHVALATDDLDTGTTIVLDVGDGDNDDAYILGSTIGQAGGYAEWGTGIVGAFPCAMFKTYTADDTIDVHVDTAPTGGGTGTIVLKVCYTFNP